MRFINGAPDHINGAPDRRAYLAPTQRAIDSVRAIRPISAEQAKSIIAALSCQLAQHADFDASVVVKFLDESMDVCVEPIDDRTDAQKAYDEKRTRNELKAEEYREESFCQTAK